jgi:hypothetical protein
MPYSDASEYSGDTKEFQIEGNIRSDLLYDTSELLVELITSVLGNHDFLLTDSTEIRPSFRKYIDNDEFVAAQLIAMSNLYLALNINRLREDLMEEKGGEKCQL